MDISKTANRRLHLLGRHLVVSTSPLHEDGGGTIVLLPCAASSNPVQFYGSRKDSRTLFARQSLEGGANFMRASTWSEVIHQTREQVPSETHPVWDSSVPPNSGGSRAADASNATAPLFARPTSMGQPRNAESTRVQKGSPLFAKQSSPASTPKETLKDEEPPSFAKPATLKVSKKESTWVPRMDVLESSSVYQVTLELPGVSPDSIRVEINRKWLLVSGERRMNDVDVDEFKVPQGGKSIYHRREMVEGPYNAKWRLPADANTLAAVAVFSDGVLKVQLPKIRHLVG